MNEDLQTTAPAALQTTNETEKGDWTGTLSRTVTLSDAEKQCLEAIARLGSFSVPWDSTAYPNEIDSLEEQEFLHRQREGQIHTRGGQRHGFDVYRLTESGKAWLQNCRREDK